MWTVHGPQAITWTPACGVQVIARGLIDGPRDSIVIKARGLVDGPRATGCRQTVYSSHKSSGREQCAYLKILNDVDIGAFGFD